MGCHPPRTLWLAGALLAGACAGGRPSGPLPAPEVQVERLVPSVDSMEQVSVTTKMTVRNPRETPVTIRAVQYSVKALEGPEWSVSNALQAGQELGSGQTVSVSLEQPIDLPAEREPYLAMLAMETIPVRMEGVLSLEDGTETPFEKRGSIAPPNMPRFVVYEAQAAVYAEEGVDVTFYLRLINENPFGVVVESAEYAIQIDGKEVAEGTAGIGVRLPAAGVQAYEVNVSIDESTWGDGWEQKMDASSLAYEMNGRLTMPNVQIPVEESGTIELQ